MKYYKIALSFYNLNDDKKRITSSANADISSANTDIYIYLKEIEKGSIIENTPMFDCFSLKSYDEKKYWNKYLLNVYGFIGPKFRIPGWFISKEIKMLLENFKLPQPHHFYPSKLKYKWKKLDYYIFQYAGKQISIKSRKYYIVFDQSIFFDPRENTDIEILTVDEFVEKKLEIEKKTEFESSIEIKRLRLKEPLDFFPMRTYLKDDIVSERLKQAIEEMGITGFEFSELDYEVVVE